AMRRMFRVAALAGYSPDIVNPAAQSVERLLRDPVILLDVPQEQNEGVRLSEEAEKTLVEYVRQGGVLVYFPVRPEGAGLDPLWQRAPENHSPPGTFEEWNFGRGRSIRFPADFYSWVNLTNDLAGNRAQPDSSAAIRSFSEIMGRSGARRSLRLTNDGEPGASVIAGMLFPNQTPAKPNVSQVCAKDRLCAAALISVTNLNPDEPADESIELSDPRSRESTPGERTISLEVTVPPGDSLLLPVHAPLCSAATPEEECSDEVISAGAELLGADRDGRTLELGFYVPARATVRLHLESGPASVEFEEGYHLESNWSQATRTLEIHVPKGPAPDYLRIVRIHLRYTP
ncbi:MAG: hypothetical protein ACRD4Y_06305, partial [Candidatus Acidiferrales bacterium]